MKTDLRFNLQHAGDIFSDAVQKTADSAVIFSKKIMRVYNLNSLHSRKKKISEEIIARASVLVKAEKSDVCRDAVLAKLVSRLHGIEQELAGYKKQKTRMVSPVTSIIAKLGKALFSSKR